MGLLRYEKNEKQKILEMHKRASRPLYENFNKEEDVNEFFFDDVADTPSTDKTAEKTYGSVDSDNLCFSIDGNFVVSSGDIPVDPSTIEDAKVIGEYSNFDEFKSDYPDTKLFNNNENIFNAYIEKFGTTLKVYDCGDKTTPKGDMDEGKDAPYGESKGASEATKGKNTPYKGK